MSKMSKISIQNKEIEKLFEKILLNIGINLKSINSSSITEYVNIFFKYIKNDLYEDYEGILIQIKNKIKKNNINLDEIILNIKKNNELNIFKIYSSLLFDKIDKQIGDDIYKIYQQRSTYKQKRQNKILIIKLIKLINIYSI